MVAEDVLILGAGFSKAISDHMPLTGRLGEQALDILRAKGVSVPSRTFSNQQMEAWLSRLAEPQPDLSAAENAQNRALFLHMSVALRHVLLESQRDTHGGDLPWWLRRLVGALHFSKSVAITFNYDTLVESAVGASNLFDDEGHRVSSSDLVKNMPPLRQVAGGGLRFGPQPAESFRYLKLHGSIDTFWTPGDISGASIGRWAVGGTWGAPRITSEEERRQLLPGTEPYIVPPAAAKSAFYANPLARELWQTAARALTDATRVTLVGYSLPMTDLVTSGMLGDALAAGGASVTIVNPGAADVADRVEALGVDPGRIDIIDRGDIMDTLATRMERHLRPGLSLPHKQDTLLCVGSIGIPRFAVRELIGFNADGTAELQVTTSDPQDSLVRLRDLGGPAGPAATIDSSSGRAYFDGCSSSRGRPSQDCSGLSRPNPDNNPGDVRLGSQGDAGFRIGHDPCVRICVFPPPVGALSTWIAREWNVKASGVGYVTRFEVEKPSLTVTTFSRPVARRSSSTGSPRKTGGIQPTHRRAHRGRGRLPLTNLDVSRVRKSPRCFGHHGR